jgi:hypothetical protein
VGFLLAAYFGAYYWTVTPSYIWLMREDGLDERIGTQDCDYKINRYELPKVANTFFQPAHWIDCLLRPKSWPERPEWAKH